MASSTPTADSDNSSQLRSLALSDKVTDQIKADLESSKLSNVANSILTECKQAQLTGLKDIITGREIALDMRRAPHPGRLDSLNELAATLVTKYVLGKQIEDLDEAIRLRFEAYDLIIRPIEPYSPPRDADAQEAQAEYLLMTLTNMQTGIRQSYEISKLDTAISLLRDALLLQPGLDTKRSAALSGLAVALLTRFNLTSQLQDLDEAILLFNEALELPLEDRPDLLSKLCAALLTKFHQTAQFQDFEDAVSWRSEGITAAGNECQVFGHDSEDEEVPTLGDSAGDFF